MSSVKRKPPGRVAVKKIVSFPLLELVQRLASIAATQVEISEFTGIPLRTLERRIAEKKGPIAEAYRAGIEERKASLLRMMWTAARAGNAILMIWLSKNLLGWKDRSEVDLVAIRRKLSKMSDDELLELGDGREQQAGVEDED